MSNFTRTGALAKRGELYNYLARVAEVVDNEDVFAEEFGDLGVFGARGARGAHLVRLRQEVPVALLGAYITALDGDESWGPSEAVVEQLRELYVAIESGDVNLALDAIDHLLDERHPLDALLEAEQRRYD